MKRPHREPALFLAQTIAPVAIGGRIRDKDNNTAIGDYQNWFNGLIDDVLITNYAMTADEVAAEYKAVTGKAACSYPPMIGDISGPDGVPDCVVDMYDIATVAGSWAGCLLLPDTTCP